MCLGNVQDKITNVLVLAGVLGRKNKNIDCDSCNPLARWLNEFKFQNGTGVHVAFPTLPTSVGQHEASS